MIKVTEVTIISGFLGAGKTTLIKKLLKEVYDDEQVVLIENEFGEIGIDGGFLQDAGVEITEMNSGCICCSLSGDFAKALQQVLEQFHPDRIIIEPSGVGKLSDVKRAVLNVTGDLKLGSSCTVVDVQKCAMYSKNFGEFFNNQIEHADVLLLSRTQHADADLTQACVETLRALNAEAPIVTTPWDQLSREEITRAMMHTGVLRKELMEEEAVCEVCGHVHDHDHAHHHHDHHDHEEGMTHMHIITIITIMTTMRMKCLPAGAGRPCVSIRGQRWKRSYTVWRRKQTMERSCVPRAWCRAKVPGITLM